MLATTPPSEVHPGYFRGTTLLVMALLVVAGLFGWAESTLPARAGLIGSGIFAYLVFFLMETGRAAAGRGALYALSLLMFVQLFLETIARPGGRGAIAVADNVAGAALLGCAMGAMLLGHYYLTAPWMTLQPLLRMVRGISASAVGRAAVSLAALYWAEHALASRPIGVADWGFYWVLRWGMGIAGPILLSLLVLKTLELKATQAATGILYVIVLFVLIGEAAGIAFLRLAGGPM